MKKVNHYKRPGAKEGYSESFQRKERKKFYQSKDWRRFRKLYWPELTAVHQKIITDLYTSDDSWITPEVFNYFIEQEAPYCIHCKAEKVLTVANVLDHIKPIKDGGAELSKKNTQSLCNRHHNIKSAKEQ
jgi:5-methylcytosine-specific restriction endonuclease McrA